MIEGREVIRAVVSALIDKSTRDRFSFPSIVEL